MHKIKNNPTNKDDAVNKKYVDDNIINKLDNTIILNNADEVNSFNKGYQSFMVEPSVADEIGLPNSPSSTWFCIHYSHSKGFEFPSQIAFEYAGSERIMYRTCGNGVWHNWRKVCTTSVEDVPSTPIISENADIIMNSNCVYEVINGMCYVTMWGFHVNTVGQHVINNSLPKPKVTSQGACSYGSEGCVGGFIFIFPDGNNGKLYVETNVTGESLYGAFSYPVSES